MEEILAGVWADVLRRERIGIYDNFFQIGGHSLFATQVIARVRRLFDVQLALRVLFDAPTVAALAEQVDRVQRETGGPSVPPLVAVPRPPRVPLSFAQERSWFLERLEPGSAAYHSPLAVRLTGRIHVDAILASLRQIVQRNEVLRTTFPMVDGVPVQAVASDALLHVRRVDVRAIAGAEAAAQREGDVKRGGASIWRVVR